MSSIEDKATLLVAQAVKDQRERRGLSLRALAARSGVSASMISDIERGAKSPTIATVSALAAALELPVAALVEGAGRGAGRIRVLRASDSPPAVDPGSGAKRVGLGPALPGSRVEFLRYTVPPRSLAGPFPAHMRGTIEHVHLASGRIKVMLGRDVVTLEAGDGCACLAEAPHGFDNREGEAEALLYLVIELP